MIGGRRAIALVARREIATRGREKSFFVSTGLTIAVIAAIIFLPSIFGGGPDRAAVAGAGAGAAIAQAATELGDRFDIELTERRVDDDAQARRLVEDGTVDVAVVADGTQVLVGEDADDAAVQAVQDASAAVRSLAALESAGVAAGEAQSILAPEPLPVTSLGDERDDQLLGFAFVVLFLLYGQILAYGIMVATGVVEEKSSRIVEILLASIRPSELLAGKVLGIGVLALAQLLLIAVAGLGLASVSGQVDVGGAELATLPVLLAWFVLGFGLYACAYAMGGALVSRQEEIGSVTTPMTMLILASFFLGFQALQSPNGLLAQIMSIVPLSSPLIMPIRVVDGSAAAWEIAVSVALSVLAIVGVVRLAGRMYGNAVLQTGGRVSLRRALSE